MRLWTILFIAVGLAMDAFAVSVVTGRVYKEFKVRHALRMVLFFGGFQAVMPVIGYLAGLGLKEVYRDLRPLGRIWATGLRRRQDDLRIVPDRSGRTQP